MRLVVVAQEMPYPPTHGLRVDIWRRLLGLRMLGHEVFLVTWDFVGAGRAINRSAIARIEQEVAMARVYSIPQTPSGFARRLPYLARMPSHAAARVLQAHPFTALLGEVREFRPDVVLLDGLLAAPTAERLADAVDRPLFYRAHNREYNYLSGQRRLARSTRARLGLFLAALHLRRFEEHMHRRAERVLDISYDDLQYWRSQGFENGFWLPPLIDPDIVSDARREPDVDIAYVGNLRTPNNVEGVLWLLREVLPLLRTKRPDFSVLIGGSSPVSEIRETVAASPGVTLLPDVSHPKDVLERGRVLVNPVFMSSGVNIKMLDMLAVGRPIVTTRQGATGLPTEARRLLIEAASAQSFADACFQSIENSSVNTETIETFFNLFGPNVLKTALL